MTDVEYLRHEAELQPRKFELGDAVISDINGRLGTIVGYEDGTHLGRHQRKIIDWVYHIRTEEEDLRIAVPEEGIRIAKVERCPKCNHIIKILTQETTDG